MDNFVDIKQEIKDEDRKNFMNKVKGNSPIRGKTIKIKVKKTIEDNSSKKEMKETIRTSDNAEPVITGRLK